MYRKMFVMQIMYRKLIGQNEIFQCYKRYILFHKRFVGYMQKDLYTSFPSVKEGKEVYK